MSAVPPDHPSPRPARFLSSLEGYAALALTLVGLYLRALQAINAGGLWRDETVSVQVARLPTWHQLWSYLEFDSYPPLFHLLLRGWMHAFGAGDDSLRTLGVLVGLGLLAACWTAARRLGSRTPLLTLALLGLSPTLIRWGDSTRAYGLGCALAVLSLAAVWKLAGADRLDRRRWLLAAGAGLLSVQCLYHNAALLLASGLAGAVVAALDRRWRVAAGVLAAGLPAALSLIPYVPIIHRTREWSLLIKVPVTPRWLWQCLTDATGVPVPGGVWFWAALVVAGMALVGWQLVTRRGPASDLSPAARRQVFAAVALGSALVIYAAFLIVLGYTTQAWYYLPLLSVVAVCLDAIFGQDLSGPGGGRLRLALCGAWVALLGWHASAWPNVRNTNLDLVARVLNRETKAADLVIVNRWECAITMSRYYHGPAPLASIPALSDHTVHRYDLVKTGMTQPDPVRPLLDTVAGTLKSGGRIWLVGLPVRPEDGLPIRALPPYRPTDSTSPWPMDAYMTNWVLQVDDLLFRHSQQGRVVEIHPTLPVSRFEELPLGVLEGWRD